MSSHIKDIKFAGSLAGQKLILRWFDSSGGKLLKTSSKHSYEDYLALAKQPQALDALTLEQIHKDVTRANFNSFHIPSLRTFLMAVGSKEETEPVLVNILMAYCNRNPYPGYAQGMDQITIMLLGLASGLDNPHSLVFWVLCGLVENLRLPDFYSPPPTGMAGFVFERRLLCSLVRGRFPALIQAAGGLQPVLDILEALCPRWLISIFLDVVELETQLLMWDFVFSCGGDLALLLLSLAVFSFLASSFDRVNGDLFIDFSTNIELLSPPLLMQHLDSINLFLIPSDLLFSEKLKHGNRKDFSLFYLLDICLQIHTVNYKTHYQSAFRQFYLRAEDGISIHHFAHVIEQINMIFPVPDEALSRLWATLFTAKEIPIDNQASWTQIIYCLSTLCGDTMNDKLHLFYHMFDLEKTGKLSESEVYALTSSLLKVCSQPQKPLQGISRELSLLYERWEELNGANDGFTFSDFRQFITEHAPLLLQVFKLPVDLHPRTLGFALPPNPSDPPVPSIRRFATVGMGFKRNSDPPGLIITKITSDGAAIKAGLDVGDVMCAVNGVSVQTREEFFVLYPLLLPGEIRTLTLSILRPATVAQRRTLGNLGTKTQKPVYTPMEVLLVLECLPPICTEIESNRARIQFNTMKKEMGLAFNYPSGKESDNRNEGLMVTEVDQGSPADKAGLELKDIITHLDGIRLLDSQTFLRAYSKVKPGDKVSFIIRRPKLGSPAQTVIFHPPSPLGSTSSTSSCSSSSSSSSSSSTQSSLNAAFYTAPTPESSSSLSSSSSPNSSPHHTPNITRHHSNSNSNSSANNSPTHSPDKLTATSVVTPITAGLESVPRSSPLKTPQKLLSRGAHLLTQVQDTAATIWNQQEIPFFDDSHYPMQVIGYDTLMLLAIVGGQGVSVAEIEDIKTKAFAPILPTDAIKTITSALPPSPAASAAISANIAASAATATASLAVAAATTATLANNAPSISGNNNNNGRNSVNSSLNNSLMNVYDPKLVPVVGMIFIPHVVEHTHGLFVSRVITGQPAEKAGLRQGDFITHLDNVAVPLRPAATYFASRHIGDSVTLTLQRPLPQLSLGSPPASPPISPSLSPHAHSSSPLAITLESPTSAATLARAALSTIPASSSSSVFGFSSVTTSASSLSLSSSPYSASDPPPPPPLPASASSSLSSSASSSSSLSRLSSLSRAPSSPTSSSAFITLVLTLKVEGQLETQAEEERRRRSSAGSRPHSRRNSYTTPRGSMMSVSSMHRESRDLGAFLTGFRTGSESPRGSQVGDTSSSSGSSGGGGGSSSTGKKKVKKYVIKRRHSAPPILNFEITPKLSSETVAPMSMLTPPISFRRSNSFRRWSTSFLGGSVSPVPLSTSAFSPDKDVTPLKIPSTPTTPTYSLRSWGSFSSLNSPTSRNGTSTTTPAISSSSSSSLSSCPSASSLPSSLPSSSPSSLPSSASFTSSTPGSADSRKSSWNVFGKAKAKAAYETGKMKLNPQIDRAQRDQTELKRKLGLTLFELFARDQLQQAKIAFRETKLQIDAIESTVIAVKKAELNLLRCAAHDVGEVLDESRRSSASFSSPPSPPSRTSISSQVHR